jgi:hypothetical protein
MSFRPFFACVSFATLSLTVLAEPHCPGKGGQSARTYGPGLTNHRPAMGQPEWPL